MLRGREEDLDTMKSILFVGPLISWGFKGRAIHHEFSIPTKYLFTLVTGILGII